MDACMSRVREVLQMELRQICSLANMALLAPNEVTRGMVLDLISDELDDAKFLSHVLCAYSDTLVSPGVPCPGVPVVPGVPGVPGVGPAGPVVGPQTDLGPAFGTGPAVFPQPGYMYSPDAPAASDVNPQNLPPLPFTGLDKKENG